MAFLNEEFSVDTLPQSSGGDFDPIPAGWYMARINSAELKDTASGTGQYINLRLDVIGPTHQGRVLWSKLNIRNASSKAEEIGRAQMGDIMRAIGLSKITDTDQFVGGEVSVKVEIKTDDYGTKNEVKAYKGTGAEPPKAPAPIIKQQTGSPGAVAKTPPWVRK